MDFDACGQLLEERRNGASVLYSYDKAGNGVKKTNAERNPLFYNAKNQLLCEEPEKQFIYDRQGGIKEESYASIIHHFTLQQPPQTDESGK